MTGDDDLKLRAQVQFGRSADDYATSDIHASGESLGRLIEFVSPSPDWQALDVATGAGHAALAFAPKVKQVIATDITQEMLDKTRDLAKQRQIGNVQVEHAEAGRLPFSDQQFDLVICRLAFHHFGDPKLALHEFFRVLKPGGCLGFSDNVTVESEPAAEYYNLYEKTRDPSHHCVYRETELAAMLASAGFTTRRSEILTKEFEFHQWADRQRVDSDNKKVLLDMMAKLPVELEPLFQPRYADGTMYFTLREIVLAAHRA